MSGGRHSPLLWTLPALTIAVFASSHLFSAPALAQPQLVESVPADGESVEALPEFVHMCFSEPIDYQAEQEGFSFSVIDPAGNRLGLRTAWLPVDERATCADIYPGRTLTGVTGEWTFEWEVVSEATGETGSGAVQFTVTREPTPAATAGPGPSPGQPGATAGPGGDRGDGGGSTEPDVLLLSLLTIGAAAVAAFVGLIGFAVRQRVGFWMHRPPERAAGEPSDHH